MSNKKTDLSTIRREYIAKPMRRAGLLADPVQQFAVWMDIALQALPEDATAMTLATSNKDGMPSARIVLLKQFTDEGFSFFTSYSSEKGVILAENPQAELLFYWKELDRQVRIQGKIKKLEIEQNTAYFNERPLGSRISAAASNQSQVIDSRDSLENIAQLIKDKYPQGDIPCPKYWGGYCLVPNRFEFWQGRENRLHDRFQYQRVENGWQILRLQP